MKLLLLLALTVVSTIGLPTEGCDPNGCLMDLLGTGAPHILTASSDCSSYVDATTYTQVVPTLTTTVTSVVTIPPPGLLMANPTLSSSITISGVAQAIPTYATHCNLPEYFSACSCLGISPTNVVTEFEVTTWTLYTLSWTSYTTQLGIASAFANSTAFSPEETLTVTATATATATETLSQNNTITVTVSSFSTEITTVSLSSSATSLVAGNLTLSAGSNFSASSTTAASIANITLAGTGSGASSPPSQPTIVLPTAVFFSSSSLLLPPAPPNSTVGPSGSATAVAARANSTAFAPAPFASPVVSTTADITTLSILPSSESSESTPAALTASASSAALNASQPPGNPTAVSTPKVPSPSSTPPSYALARIAYDFWSRFLPGNWAETLAGLGHSD